MVSWSRARKRRRGGKEKQQVQTREQQVQSVVAEEQHSTGSCASQPLFQVQHSLGEVQVSAGLEEARLTSSTSRCFSSSSTPGRLEGSLAKQASRKSEQSLDTQAYAQSSPPLHIQPLADPSTTPPFSILRSPPPSPSALHSYPLLCSNPMPRCSYRSSRTS